MHPHRQLRAWIGSLGTLVTFLSFSTPITWAEIDVLVVTGDDAPGVAGALVAGVSPGAVNDAGQVAFRGTMQAGFASVDSSNDDALWRVDGTTGELMAREGSAAPGGGFFATFSRATIDSAGNVALRGKLAAGQTGTWRLASPSSGAVVARTVDLAVPGMPAGARFETFEFRLLQSTTNVIAFGAAMKSGLGGVTTDDRRGVWLDDATSAVLVARGNVTEAPGVVAGRFFNFAVSAVNDSAQIAVIGVLKTGVGGVTSSNDAGIWRLTASGGDLVARRGIGAAPGGGGAVFEQFHDPVINSAGKIAFDATLLGGVRGVWRYDGAAGSMMARSGQGTASGTAGAMFADFAAPLLNDADQVLFQGTLATGVGDAVAGNEVGLWLNDSGGSSLLARTGSGGVPGIAGANFSAFNSIALNSQGVTAVSAELAIGPGGVSSGNEHGIWLLDADGGNRLIARTGEELAGRTIASLEMLGDTGGGDGRARSLNNTGQLAFKAAFTDGAEAMLLYSPESSSEYAADFDGDTDVDGDDLARWTTNFGAGPGATKAQGDADTDGDVDGADFLQWQREVTGNPIAAPTSTPIPEPGAQMLVLAAILAAAVDRLRPIASARRWR